MSQPIEQCGCHFGIAEALLPLLKTQIGRHDQSDLCIQFTDEMEQESSATLRERQVPQFIQDDKLYVPLQSFCEASGVPSPLFLLQLVGQIGDVRVPDFVSLSVGVGGDGGGKTALAGAADQDDLACVVDERT